MMKRPCAIKVIHPNKADDPQAFARFEREVHAMANSPTGTRSRFSTMAGPTTARFIT